MLKTLVVSPHSAASGNSLQCSVLCVAYSCALKNPAMA